MKTFIIIIFNLSIGTFVASAQALPPVEQKGGERSVNIAGNNNTVASLICHGLDPKVAEQVRAILTGTLHNE